ncbi:hypothetical protein HELRODRAFT_84047 [Helobdella robusta]|uniref:Uncharacterized protein n=1 Tax=Helobdella robusta TaxID=6412 RepID=T1G5D9_HELRO|nr:hypothetical protein HELRODRAFT_84047 [Helobdella robusta]ESN99610.1 hypothetical protein HELRODRAFT_84047 [Helobdella robusta]
MNSLECRAIIEEEIISEVHSHWWKHLVAGGVAGAVSRSCTAPLDRIKIFLQVPKNKTPLTLRNASRAICKEGGVFSFWRGNGVNIVKVVPEIAIKFTLYDEKKLMLYRENEEAGMFERMAAGGSAGFISQTIVYPLEVMKTRLALRQTNQSSWSCVRDIFQQGGCSPRAFFLGYSANVVGIVPYAAIDLAVYETLKRRYMEYTNTTDTPHSFALFGCALMSSLLGQTVTYPLNLVKTRKQATIVSKTSHHLSLASYLRLISRTEGIPGLYRGLSANLLKVGPAVSLVYVVYERVREFLDAPMR